jgi:hypothetical protein
MYSSNLNNNELGKSSSVSVPPYSGTKHYLTSLKWIREQLLMHSTLHPRYARLQVAAICLTSMLVSYSVISWRQRSDF